MLNFLNLMLYFVLKNTKFVNKFRFEKNYLKKRNHVKNEILLFRK